jgi:hypothetical protein
MAGANGLPGGGSRERLFRSMFYGCCEVHIPTSVNVCSPSRGIARGIATRVEVAARVCMGRLVEIFMTQLENRVMPTVLDLTTVGASRPPGGKPARPDHGRRTFEKTAFDLSRKRLRSAVLSKGLSMEHNLADSTSFLERAWGPSLHRGALPAASSAALAAQLLRRHTSTTQAVVRTERTFHTRSESLFSSASESFVGRYH